MTDAICSKISKALNTSLVKEGNRLKIRLIDISDAAMTSAQFNTLLAVGMGKFETKQLVLTNNELTDSAISDLSSCVKESKTAFRKLRRLDLRNNRLIENYK